MPDLRVGLRSLAMGIRVPTPGTLVTLVEGGSFCVSDASGDILDQVAGGPSGLFVGERRLLSRLVLIVNGHRLEPVDHHVDDPAAATFVGRALSPDPGRVHATGPVVVRRRTLGAGLRDHIDVRNVGDEPTYVEIEIDLASDLAPLVAVRATATAWQTRSSPPVRAPTKSCWCGAAARPGSGAGSRAPRASRHAGERCAGRRSSRRRARVRSRWPSPPSSREPSWFPARSSRPTPAAASPPASSSAGTRRCPASPATTSRSSPRCAAAPATSGRCGCSTPTSRGGLWWRPPCRGTWPCTAVTPCSPRG